MSQLQSEPRSAAGRVSSAHAPSSSSSTLMTPPLSAARQQALQSVAEKLRPTTTSSSSTNQVDTDAQTVEEEAHDESSRRPKSRPAALAAAEEDEDTSASAAPASPSTDNTSAFSPSKVGRIQKGAAPVSKRRTAAQKKAEEAAQAEKAELRRAVERARAQERQGGSATAPSSGTPIFDQAHNITPGSSIGAGENGHAESPQPDADHSPATAAAAPPAHTDDQPPMPSGAWPGRRHSGYDQGFADRGYPAGPYPPELDYPGVFQVHADSAMTAGPSHHSHHHPHVHTTHTFGGMQRYLQSRTDPRARPPSFVVSPPPLPPPPPLQPSVVVGPPGQMPRGARPPFSVMVPDAYSQGNSAITSPLMPPPPAYAGIPQVPPPPYGVSPLASYNGGAFNHGGPVVNVLNDTRSPRASSPMLSDAGRSMPAVQPPHHHHHNHHQQHAHHQRAESNLSYQSNVSGTGATSGSTAAAQSSAPIPDVRIFSTHTTRAPSAHGQSSQYRDEAAEKEEVSREVSGHATEATASVSSSKQTEAFTVPPPPLLASMHLEQPWTITCSRRTGADGVVAGSAARGTTTEGENDAPMVAMESESLVQLLPTWSMLTSGLVYEQADKDDEDTLRPQRLGPYDVLSLVPAHLNEVMAAEHIAAATEEQADASPAIPAPHYYCIEVALDLTVQPHNASPSAATAAPHTNQSAVALERSERLVKALRRLGGTGKADEDDNNTNDNSSDVGSITANDLSALLNDAMFTMLRVAPRFDSLCDALGPRSSTPTWAGSSYTRTTATPPAAAAANASTPTAALTSDLLDTLTTSSTSASPANGPVSRGLINPSCTSSASCVVTPTTGEINATTTELTDGTGRSAMQRSALCSLVVPAGGEPAAQPVGLQIEVVKAEPTASGEKTEVRLLLTVAMRDPRPSSAPLSDDDVFTALTSVLPAPLIFSSRTRTVYTRPFDAPREEEEEEEEEEEDEETSDHQRSEGADSTETVAISETTIAEWVKRVWGEANGAAPAAMTRELAARSTSQLNITTTPRRDQQDVANPNTNSAGSGRVAERDAPAQYDTNTETAVPAVQQSSDAVAVAEDSSSAVLKQSETAVYHSDTSLHESPSAHNVSPPPRTAPTPPMPTAESESESESASPEQGLPGAKDNHNANDDRAEENTTTARDSENHRQRATAAASSKEDAGVSATRSIQVNTMAAPLSELLHTLYTRLRGCRQAAMARAEARGVCPFEAMTMTTTSEETDLKLSRRAHLPFPALLMRSLQTDQGAPNKRQASVSNGNSGGGGHGRSRQRTKAAALTVAVEGEEDAHTPQETLLSYAWTVAALASDTILSAHVLASCEHAHDTKPPKNQAHQRTGAGEEAEAHARTRWAEATNSDCSLVQWLEAHVWPILSAMETALNTDAVRLETTPLPVTTALPSSGAASGTNAAIGANAANAVVGAQRVVANNGSGAGKRGHRRGGGGGGGAGSEGPSQVGPRAAAAGRAANADAAAELSRSSLHPLYYLYQLLQFGEQDSLTIGLRSSSLPPSAASAAALSIPAPPPAGAFASSYSVWFRQDDADAETRVRTALRQAAVRLQHTIAELQALESALSEPASSDVWESVVVPYLQQVSSTLREELAQREQLLAEAHREGRVVQMHANVQHEEETAEENTAEEDVDSAYGAAAVGEAEEEEEVEAELPHTDRDVLPPSPAPRVAPLNLAQPGGSTGAAPDSHHPPAEARPTRDGDEDAVAPPLSTPRQTASTSRKQKPSTPRAGAGGSKKAKRDSNAKNATNSKDTNATSTSPSGKARSVPAAKLDTSSEPSKPKQREKIANADLVLVRHLLAPFLLVALLTTLFLYFA